MEINGEIEVPPIPNKLVTCDYGELGDYKASIIKYLDTAMGHYKGGYEEISQEHSFYLNSSDSLESLDKQNFEGKRVMSVSGSGEFAHVFINRGASEVVCFDISPAAGFYTELRHVALCSLSMQDYIKLFDQWQGASYDKDLPFLNKDIYSQVKEQLSDEARFYFDEILENGKYKGLLLHGDKRGNRRKGFSRWRRNDKYPRNRYVGDIIKTEEEYLELQEKAKKIKIAQVIGDAKHTKELMKNFEADDVYISNIGYGLKETSQLARSFLDLGVGEVIMTATADEYCFRFHNRNDFDIYQRIKVEPEPGQIYYENEKLSVGSVFKFREYDEQMNLLPPVDIEVLGIDNNVDYGVTLKIVNKKKR